MDYSPTTWVEKITKVGPTRMNAIEAALADASTHHKRGTWAAIPAADAASKNWTYWCTDRGVLYGNFDGATWTRIGGDAPLGGIVEDAHFAGAAGTGFLSCDGQAVSRTTYADLFAALVQDGSNGNITTGSNQITSTIPPNITPGMFIEAPGIPAGTRVVSNVFSAGFWTVTMDKNATATGNVGPIRYGRWGFGDGSTTFNVPLLNNVGCKLWWNTASRSWGTAGGIPWDKEAYDPAGLHDPAIAADIAIPVSGKWKFDAQVGSTVTLPSTINAEIYISLQRQRGAAIDNLADGDLSAAGSVARLSETVDLIAGDKIRLVHTNSSTTGVTISGASERVTHIEAHLLGGAGPIPKMIKAF
jgi:hypothetical protein